MCMNLSGAGYDRTSKLEKEAKVMRELLYKEYVLKIRESSSDTDIEIIKDGDLVLQITFAPGVSDEIILQGVEESLEIVNSMKCDAGKKQ